MSKNKYPRWFENYKELQGPLQIAYDDGREKGRKEQREKDKKEDKTNE